MHLRTRSYGQRMVKKARKRLEEDGVQVDDEIKSDNDASKVSTRIGDTMSIDDGIATTEATATTTVNEIPLAWLLTLM